MNKGQNAAGEGDEANPGMKKKGSSKKKTNTGGLVVRKQAIESLTKERDKLRKDLKNLARMMNKYRDQAARQHKSLQMKVSSPRHA